MTNRMTNLRNYSPGMDYGTDPAAQARREVKTIDVLDNIYQALLELISLQKPLDKQEIFVSDNYISDGRHVDYIGPRDQKLLPCPFCGSSNVDPKGWATLPQYANTPEERSGPACDDCGASARTIKIWNTRVSAQTV